VTVQTRARCRREPTGSPQAALAAWIALVCLVVAFDARAQTPRPGTTGRAAPGLPAERGDGMVQLDFDDVELSVVIDTIAKLTRKNFIYDDRVRGRVTIISHERIPIDLAYAVFESALQMKGFTTVEGPGGATRIIPIRDAKESSIETSRSDDIPPFRDHYVTRLIPLEYIDAESITNTLKPLVSKDAAMFAYRPTNSIILTDSASNIRRILEILDLIDVETYKETQALPAWARRPCAPRAPAARPRPRPRARPASGAA
jgi:general secretion pathway protein D